MTNRRISYQRLNIYLTETKKNTKKLLQLILKKTNTLHQEEQNPRKTEKIVKARKHQS